MATCRDISVLLSGPFLRYLLFLEQTERYFHRLECFAGRGMYRHMMDDHLFFSASVRTTENTVSFMKLTPVSVHTSQRTHC